MTSTQQQYLAEWHDSFVNYTAQMSKYVDTMKLMPDVTDADRQTMDLFKALLHSRDVEEVEKDLAERTIKNSMLDKIEKLDKDMVDFAVEHIFGTPAFKEVLKRISYHQIEWNKQMGLAKLNELQIPIVD
jgi:hypothetical protein